MRASLSALSTDSEPPGVKKTRFTSRGQRRDPFCELDRSRMRVGPDRVEGEFPGLTAARLRELLATVPRVHAEQRRQAVKEALALVVPDVAAVAPDDQRDGMVLMVSADVGEVHPQVALRAGLQAKPATWSSVSVLWTPSLLSYVVAAVASDGSR